MGIERIPAWVADTNAYLVHNDSGIGLLVDAPPDPDEIGAHIARLDVAVVGILLTHGHIDHIGGAGKLSAGSGAVTYAHPDDDFLTMHPTEQLRAMFALAPPGSYEVPETIEELSHGQILELAGVSLEVRHTPGHTPGHCCFYWGSEGVLFTGDQLFAGSVGRTDLPGGSWDRLLVSMREQVMTLDDEVRVLPGHGPETTIARERATNPFRDQWAEI
ncbi:MAG TPA: MBL fold metallo-hydrolase [Acidimicrobiia bacterium]|nr:MBL fold metallo-hydrolase [Acidimicrobiia bacterium]